MLTQTESRILGLLFDDLTRRYSMLEISKTLKIPYPQTHRNIKSLVKKDLVASAQQGKSVFIGVSVTEVKKEYITAELLRRDEAIKKYSKLKLVMQDLERIPKLQYACIVFGSYAKGAAKPESDIDLLFIIPTEYDYGSFEKNAKNSLLTANVDINIAFDESLHEMWSNPKKLNVGNELLKGHIILKGAEAFLEALRMHNVG
ncbi:nucleotidyltransferase domain-containing protein [Candidatus Woesearchaeota archaeon]|nr:nucleotidyltransferase domain-containing protein [Candidatus Woesearchaeota archaeon]